VWLRPARVGSAVPGMRCRAAAGTSDCFITAALDAAALRRVGSGHLAGGDSPRGSPWNGCGWAAITLNGVVNHTLHNFRWLLFRKGVGIGKDVARHLSFGFSEAWTHASAGDFP
jgi:hypothetical protein